ncbi:MAG: hypothetical protein ACJAT3_001184 [Akkermansiaceae bacterium]
MGRLIDALDKSPHAKNTIVVLWASAKLIDARSPRMAARIENLGCCEVPRP